MKSTKGSIDVSRKPSEKAARALTVALLGVLWGRGLTPTGLRLQSTLKQGLSEFSQAGLELVSPLTLAGMTDLPARRVVSTPHNLIV